MGNAMHQPWITVTLPPGEATDNPVGLVDNLQHVLNKILVHSCFLMIAQPVQQDAAVRFRVSIGGGLRYKKSPIPDALR
jgi:hypothetical protein